MHRQNWLITGYISKPHGTAGKVVVRLNGDLAKKFVPGEPLFLEIDETMVPFFIEETEEFFEKVILKLEFIDSPENAIQFVGSKVYLNLKKSDIKEKEIISLIGFEIRDEVSGLTGTITGFTDTPYNPLFEVKNSEKEFYIPHSRT
jgi:16S rRNA processing protein RimM